MTFKRILAKFKIASSMKRIIFMLIGITTIITSCKKYEEGPCISFRSPLKRIYGYYNLSSYTINGVDSLTFFNDSMGSSFYFLHDDVYDVNDLIIDGKRNDGVYAEGCVFRWSLKSSNKIFIGMRIITFCNLKIFIA